MQCIVEAEEFY